MDIEQIRKGVEESLKLYPRIPRATLVHMVVSGAKPSVPISEWNQANTDVMMYLYEEVQNGRLIHTKGAKGGIHKPTLVEQHQSYAAVMHSNQTESVTVAANDHVCPSCKNDRVSKAERTCWKCGSSLH